MLRIYYKSRWAHVKLWNKWLKRLYIYITCKALKNPSTHPTFINQPSLKLSYNFLHCFQNLFIIENHPRLNFGNFWPTHFYNFTLSIKNCNNFMNLNSLTIYISIILRSINMCLLLNLRGFLCWVRCPSV